MGKTFKIVWSILLDNAVVAEIFLAKLFYITQRGITPKTRVYQSHCDHDLYPFKHYNTVYAKSVPGMATNLTLNYANFAPVNVWNFTLLHVCTMLR